MDGSERVVAPFKVGEVVYAEMYDVEAGHYVSVTSVVKGKWRVYPSDQHLWHVVVELRCDVGSGLSRYKAEDVVPVDPQRVSRTQSTSVMPTGSEFDEIHTTDLPEVKLRQYRLVEQE